NAEAAQPPTPTDTSPCPSCMRDVPPHRWRPGRRRLTWSGCTRGGRPAFSRPGLVAPIAGQAADRGVPRAGLDPHLPERPRARVVAGVLALTLLLPLTGGAQPVAGFPEHAPVRQVALLDSPTGTHQDVEGDSEEASEDEAPYLPDPDAEPKRHRIEGLAVPLISYSTDFGVGYGGTGGMYVYHPDYYPFRWALSAQAYWTTRSIQNHYIRLDAPQLIGDARIEARGEYRRELLSPYFGLGNASAPGFSGNLADPRVNYARTFPGGWVRARYRPFGLKHPFEPWISYGFNLFDVAPIAGSVLEQDQPRGIEGGRDGQLSIGMSWDTRDDQHATTRGGSEEIALRAAGRLTFGDYGYVGVTL